MPAAKKKSAKVVKLRTAKGGDVVKYAHPPQNMFELIARAARDPNFDVDKFDRLLVAQERQRALDAKEAFFAELAIMQPELPVIAQRGKLIIRDKQTQKIVQTTPFATWPDINDVIKPILASHQFSLNFKTDAETDGRLRVTGILSRGLHSMESSYSLPADTTGSKNNVQAIGSSTSYGKRYTAIALLNLTSRVDEIDDDGASGGGTGAISEDQLKELTKAIEDGGPNTKKFCEAFEIADLKELPAVKFKEALERIAEYKKQKSQTK